MRISSQQFSPVIPKIVEKFPILSNFANKQDKYKGGADVFWNVAKKKGAPMVDVFPPLSLFFQKTTHPFSLLLEEDRLLWHPIFELNKFLLSGRLAEMGDQRTKIHPSVVIENSEMVFIDENVVIEPFVFIQGPCWIGAHAQVRHSAQLRGGVMMGEHAIVGHGSEIKNSLLLPHSSVAHLNYVGDSIIGAHSKLGAGAKCANVRLDNKLISLRLKEKKSQTPLYKLGTILGDYCRIGCNCVLMPGSVYPPQTHIFPGKGTRVHYHD